MIGQTFGRYDILALLGEGGMAHVFSAIDTASGRKVAIKVVKPHLAQGFPAYMERFVREAQTMERLAQPCPGIVQIYDYGRIGDKPYLAMEYLEGETLGDRIQRGPIPRLQALQILRCVAKTVADVHRQGVIHRDLKPDNIFLLRDRKDGRLTKLLDFGIAKPTSEQPLTAAGEVFGTPQYMSYHQLHSAHETDATDDAWALMAILYEMITGQRAYSAGVNEPGRMIESRNSLPYRRDSLREPEWRLIAKGLNPDRKQQYASVDELVDGVDAILNVAVTGVVAPRPVAVDDTRPLDGVPAAPGGFTQVFSRTQAVVVQPMVDKRQVPAAADRSRDLNWWEGDGRHVGAKEVIPLLLTIVTCFVGMMFFGKSTSSPPPSSDQPLPSVVIPGRDAEVLVDAATVEVSPDAGRRHRSRSGRRSRDRAPAILSTPSGLPVRMQPAVSPSVRDCNNANLSNDEIAGNIRECRMTSFRRADLCRLLRARGWDVPCERGDDGPVFRTITLCREVGVILPAANTYSCVRVAHAPVIVY